MGIGKQPDSERWSQRRRCFISIIVMDVTFQKNLVIYSIMILLVTV